MTLADTAKVLHGMVKARGGAISVDKKNHAQYHVVDAPVVVFLHSGSLFGSSDALPEDSFVTTEQLEILGKCVCAAILIDTPDMNRRLMREETHCSEWHYANPRALWMVGPSWG